MLTERMTLVVIASIFFLLAICGNIKFKEHSIGTIHNPMRILLGSAAILLAFCAYLMPAPKVDPPNPPHPEKPYSISLEDLAPKQISGGQNSDPVDTSSIKAFLTDYVSAFTTLEPEKMKSFYATIVNPYFNFKVDTSFEAILADSKQFGRRFVINSSELRELKMWGKTGQKYNFSILCYQRRYDKKEKVTDDKTFILSGSLIKAADTYRIVAVYNDEPRAEKTK